MTPFILLILGLLFIFLEFYLPGAIMGTIGGIMVVASVITFIGQHNSPAAVILFSLGVIASIVLLIRYTLRWIPRSTSGFNIYLGTDQEGYQASTFDPKTIGKTGVVIADLKPGGYITVSGKKHQAISTTGYIPQGTEVVVIGGREESLLVRPKSRN